MARLKPSFARYVTIYVIGVHLFLLPALYFGVGFVIRKSQEDLFLQHALTFARVLADEFEVGAALDSRGRTSDMLDLAIIHGEGRYAEFVDRNVSIRSSLGSPDISAPNRMDRGFGQGGDDIYFVVLPIVRAGHTAELRLGFDEKPTKDRIQVALTHMLLLLGGYFLATIAAAFYLSDHLSRPITRLQEESRAISLGDYAQSLQVTTDIRELHELAIDLEAMRCELVGVNDRLQEKIREKELSDVRRGELQKQLRHRQRLETVGTLAGGIAHEFNNVLVPIILFTDVAIDELPHDSPAKEDLGRVLASARRAKDIVQKILTFSHVLSDTKLAPTDLTSVVRESVTLFTALVPPTIEVRTEIATEMALVSADPALTMDLVMNLCTNAYQAMQTSGGILTIGLRSAGQRTDDPEVEMWVADNGHGMDPDTTERIFEPFFTTRPVGQGTGLGLSVVHGIVESFGGRITVESELGFGTTFRIFFPAIAGRKLSSDVSDA